jgi:hypothetical protein
MRAASISVAQTVDFSLLLEHNSSSNKRAIPHK